jgi:membrane protein
MFKAAWSVAFAAVRSFIADESLQLAAALSYYALLSMAPLLLIVVAVAGFFFADQSVQTQLIAQMRALVGDQGAALTETILDNARGTNRGLLAGTALTILGATTVFAQLQMALNRVWGVKSKPGNAVLGFLRHRLLSVALVVSIGFLLMVSLVVSAVLAALHELLDASMGTLLIWEAINLIVSFGMTTALIGLIFKYLPDAVVPWRDVWIGAVVTALLFVAGKWLIGLYLGQASLGSWFGAAGSVVVFMIWIYYASLIFLFGAEITQALALHRGERIEPSEHAETAEAP